MSFYGHFRRLFYVIIKKHCSDASGTRVFYQSLFQVSFDDEQEKDTVREQYHLGRCDVGSPWAKGTVTNCDAVDTSGD